MSLMGNLKSVAAVLAPSMYVSREPVDRSIQPPPRACRYSAAAAFDASFNGAAISMGAVASALSQAVYALT